MHREGSVVAGDPAAADEQVGGHVEEGVGGPLVGVDRFALRHVDALHVRFGAASQLGGLRAGLFGSRALWCRVCGGVFGRGGHGVPFGLGRPVWSTLTLLILVPHSPLPRGLLRAPDTCPTTRAGSRRVPFARLRCPFSPARPASSAKHPMRPKHTEGGRIHNGCSPLRGWVLVRYASALIGDYGRPSPERMLDAHPQSPAPHPLRW